MLRERETKSMGLSSVQFVSFQIAGPVYFDIIYIPMIRSGLMEMIFLHAVMCTGRGMLFWFMFDPCPHRRERCFPGLSPWPGSSPCGGKPVYAMRDG